MPRTSAGILLYRDGPDGDPEVLLVHPGGPFWAKKDDGAWSIPKGEHGPGDDPRACAVRELEEETGLTVDPAALVELGSVKQSGGKVVTAFACLGDCDPDTLTSNTFELEWPPRSGRIQAFPEVDRAAWFAPEAARRKLVPAQASFVDRLVATLRDRP